MEPNEFFNSPTCAAQRQYEALKAFYIDGLSTKDAAQKFGFSPTYFKKLKFDFSKKIIEAAGNPFFKEKKTGPKKRITSNETVDKIVSLRKQNQSIQDIKSILSSDGINISLDTIDKILKSEGFAPLPKRTRIERLCVKIPEKIIAPKSKKLDIIDEEFTTEKSAGVLVFLPLLERLGVIHAIQKSNFPKTKKLSDIHTVLSFIALKILGNERLSHDTNWNMDRGLGFFAGLNVLPKNTTLSTYSYRTKRKSIVKFLSELSMIFKDEELEEGEFNLDFKSIPHWGDQSVLEKNWSGSRNKAIKSLLALIVEDPSTGNVVYTDAELKRKDQNNAVIDFVDFWKDGRGESPKLLIFDSRFTIYENLNKLNKSQDKIKFITIRRRGKKLIESVSEITSENWQTINISRTKGKTQQISISDSRTKLRNYEGEIRQIILKDHGRSTPTFLITNDFNMEAKRIVEKYSRRWSVEKEIAEQIEFFSLNHPSSSIVVKVDFDLCISLLVHNLYRLLSKELTGFEQCNVPTIFRKFLDNGAKIQIHNRKVKVIMKKKNHIPILFKTPWLNTRSYISWMDIEIDYEIGTFS
jgi:transposase